MSKSKHNKFKDDYEDDDMSYSKVREENQKRRKQKRLKAALKTRNINDLMRFDDE